MVFLIFSQVDVERITLPNGRMIPASKFGGDMESDSTSLSLTADEIEIQNKAREIWKSILNVEINDNTDFFECGAGSMDVVRLGKSLFEKSLTRFCSTFSKADA